MIIIEMSLFYVHEKQQYTCFDVRGSVNEEDICFYINSIRRYLLFALILLQDIYCLRIIILVL